MGTITDIRRRLEFLYGSETAASTLASIKGVLEKYKGGIPRQPAGWSEKDALLITYADSITGSTAPLQTLHRFLRERVGDALSFVHLLPFYPFTSDDGFSVTDFRVVRGDLGDWADVEVFSRDYRLVFDAVINHVSASSHYAEGCFAGDPAYRDFLIALDPQTDTSSVLRTRNLPLLHDFETSGGKQWFWTTFSRDQLDLNYANPSVLVEILDVLLFYAQKGAAMLRLDAIPYLWKELGTSCAHLPQTHEAIKLIRDVLDQAAPEVLLLTETNVPHRENVRYFGECGDEAQMIYNFSLAPLILWTLFKGNATVLTQWAKGLEWIGPRATYLNITATHDGIGMRPTEGILSEPERAELVQLAYRHGGDVTGKRNADGSISPYELNLCYFDAINDPHSGESDTVQIARFLLSQVIPMSLMGIPGIYLQSLLGSRNDDEGVQRTGRARSINRPQLSVETLEAELADPGLLRGRVFAQMVRLLRVRAGEPAFHPDAAQEVLDAGSEVFALRRFAGGRQLFAVHNVSGRPLDVCLPELHPLGCCRDLISGEELRGERVALTAYQARWLVPAALCENNFQ